MAKQIIVLNKSISETEVSYEVLFWHPITSGMQSQTNGSQWAGASTTENDAIKAGTVLEEAHSFSFPAGIAAANIEAVLQQAWSNRNGQLAGVGPAQYNGTYYDPTGGGWA
ncbi:MAG: hypothetical protein KGL39_34195 [Patescibacteria group bacterium]|nr:hypothetical protein [Patescibacteria group bacterium]